MAAHLDESSEPVARRVRKQGECERVVGTSKTFRSLARLTGAAPSIAGLRTRRTLTDASLRQMVAFISRMSSRDLAELEGVSAGRGPSAGGRASVAEAAMRATELEVCPWALREGVTLRRLDTLEAGVPAQRRWPLTDLHTRPWPGPAQGAVGNTPP